MRVALGWYLKSAWMRWERSSTAARSGRAGGKARRVAYVSQLRSPRSTKGESKHELERFERFGRSVRRELVAHVLPRPDRRRRRVARLDVHHARGHGGEAVVALENGERGDVVAEVVLVRLDSTPARGAVWMRRFDERLPGQRPRRQAHLALALRDRGVVEIAVVCVALYSMARSRTSSSSDGRSRDGAE